MTRLSFLVISIFIFLTAAMWYLANASFEEHIHNKIQKLSESASNLQVRIDKIEQVHNQVRINNISFFDNTTPLANLSLTGIQVTINQENSKKNNIINIEQLAIEQVTIHFNSITDKKALINTLTDSLKSTLTVEESLKINKKSPLIIVKKIKLDNTIINDFLFEESEQTEQQSIIRILLYILSQYSQNTQ